jgi:predicted nucleic acid-binding protein
LQGHIIGLDTAPLIYYIEQDPQFLPLVEPFFQAFDQGAFTLVTSIVTLLEVLVGVLKKGDVASATQYRRILLGTPGLRIMDVDEVIAETAARIRAEYRLLDGTNKQIKTPDAIQLATANVAGARYFFTGEQSFPSIGGMTIVTPQMLR